MRRALGLVAIVLIGVLGLTAGRNHPGSPSPLTLEPTPSPSRPATPLPTAFVRTCADSVGGTMTPVVWRHTLYGGPLAVVWLRRGGDLSPGSIGHHLRGFEPADYLVVVRQGHEVTLSVPRSQQGHVAFLYNASPPSPDVPIQVGNTSVTLQACPGTSRKWDDGTQFIGQILVGRSTCVVLDVREAATHRVWQLTAPFGSASTCARAFKRVRSGTNPPGPF